MLFAATATSSQLFAETVPPASPYKFPTINNSKGSAIPEIVNQQVTSQATSIDNPSQYALADAQQYPLDLPSTSSLLEIIAMFG